MNLDYNEAKTLLKSLMGQKDKFPEDVTIIICPSAPYLSAFSEVLKDQEWVQLGAQNNYFEDSGAHTGEVSPTQLKSLGVSFCIVGHSERRNDFNEDYGILSKKVKALLKHGIRPVFCCGEQLQVRDSNVYKEFVIKQIEDSLFKFSAEEIQKIVIIITITIQFTNYAIPPQSISSCVNYAVYGISKHVLYFVNRSTVLHISFQMIRDINCSSTT